MQSTAKTLPNADIAIIGAGPVGLLLAILLSKHRISVTVVERWPDIYDRPRAVTMDAEVARILATLGINVDEDPAFENHKELYYWKNADLLDLQIVDWESLAPSGWHVTYWFNQPELEARLIEMANDIPLITILRGWTVNDVTQDADAVQLRMSDTEKSTEYQSLSARFLVGADGANSFVREHLGIGEIDKGYFFDWLILDMIPDEPYTTSPAQWQLCDPKRPTTIVPGGPGRRRWEFMLLPDEDREEIAKPEAAWRLLEPWGLTPQNAKLERSAVYKFQAKWAETWVQDRCMIAGDAAHLMPPFAGEGMCAGLRDAVALSWRLAGILDGSLPQDVLQSYESERMEHAKHYIQFSQDLGEIICITDPDKAAERDARMIAGLSARDNQPITGDLVKLGAGAWCEESAGAGELSPQGFVRFNESEDRFDQAVGQSWLILAINQSTTDILNPAQSEIFAQLNGRVLSVGDSNCHVKTLDDSYTTWMQNVDGNFAIIRPDFYVAATAKTPEGVRACFDQIITKLALT